MLSPENSSLANKIQTVSKFPPPPPFGGPPLGFGPATDKLCLDYLGLVMMLVDSVGFCVYELDLIH